jgi:glycerol-3-phosphate acyltransferase PlsY
MSWSQELFGPAVPMSHAVGIVLGCYLLGCFATGYYVVRFRLGRDVRELGSGNTGARNVGRILGPGGFFVALLGDFGKGTLAAVVVWQWTLDGRLAALAMLAVVAGHIWPAQLGLHGGKGVATSLGALMVCDFEVALALAGSFIVSWSLLRRTVPSGLVAFGLMPLAAMFLGRQPWEVIALSLLAGMVLLAHRKNFVEEFAAFAARRAVQPKPDQSFK